MGISSLSSSAACRKRRFLLYQSLDVANHPFDPTLHGCPNELLETLHEQIQAPQLEDEGQPRLVADRFHAVLAVELVGILGEANSCRGFQLDNAKLIALRLP
jgi:hypothetical protein